MLGPHAYLGKIISEGEQTVNEVHVVCRINWASHKNWSPHAWSSIMSRVHSPTIEVAMTH